MMGGCNPTFPMDLKQLEYFVRVAELGSFTRAANVLRVAQPALGIVDLAEVYRGKEDEFTRRLTAARSDEERQATLQMARSFAQRLPVAGKQLLGQQPDAVHVEQRAIGIKKNSTGRQHASTVLRTPELINAMNWR